MLYTYETDRLILKILDDTYAADVLEFYRQGDGYFGKMEPEREEGFYTEEYHGYALKYESKLFLTDKSARYYIYERNKNKIIGTVSLRNVKKGCFSSAEIGYKMLKEYTSKGYCKEAVKCIVDAAFRDCGIHKVIAYVQPDNFASINVLSYAGFIKEGISRDYVKLEGKWISHLVYACIDSGSLCRSVCDEDTKKEIEAVDEEKIKPFQEDKEETKHLQENKEETKQSQKDKEETKSFQENKEETKHLQEDKDRTKQLQEDEKYMRQAIVQAKKAEKINEVPIGCVIVHEGKVIAKGYNRRNKDKSTLSHAEITAIKKASKILGDWRLEECTLYVTLEPCQMCAGAIVQARIPRVVMGTMNAKAGCAGSVINLLSMDGFNHKVSVTKGVLMQECKEMMQEFFKTLRAEKQKEKNIKIQEGK